METLFSCREVMNILPHRFPFLLVDKVVAREDGPEAPRNRAGNKITAIKNVTFNEPFFPGHFPGMPIMPGVLQIEAMAQAACLAYVRDGDPEFDFLIASVQEAKFRRPVVPGDQLVLNVEITKDRGSMLQIQAQATVDGQQAASVTILAKVAPRSARS